MTIKVKNSQSSYKYNLSPQQFLPRGSSLQTTFWIYGIVVYTGNECKIRQHENRRIDDQIEDDGTLPSKDFEKESNLSYLMGKFFNFMMVL